MVKMCKVEVVFDQDEYICEGVVIDNMIKFCFVFDCEGIVMVGNVFGINDGVVVFVFMIVVEVKLCGIEFLVCIVLFG